ncbi:hypothetical protein DICVIV_02065 [Dictyocaulus viviparus]|uniref:Uncharacterized protein n=1 Tax=Dictyocaulus viviparus TaxID=29172 RepID=A0A0D8Y719_DICVI|nr:hypothetical protein DICVIV_02065 [Dictyocaulus viviparus]
MSICHTSGCWSDQKIILAYSTFDGLITICLNRQKKSTIINDVVRPSLSSDILNGVVGRNQCMSYNTVEQAAHKNNMSLNEEVPLIDKRSKQSIRNFGLSLLPENGYCDIKSVCDSKTTSGTYRDTRDAEHLQHCETKSPSRYTDVKMSSSERFKESSSIPRNPGNNEPSDEISMPHSGIAINTFGEREKQSSVTNLTFRPQTATCAAELFERPDSLTLNSPSVTFSTSRNPKLLPPRVTRRGLLTVLPDEVDRSIGSSTLLESDALRDDDGDSYVADAEIRLNLFMKDVPKDETTV